MSCELRVASCKLRIANLQVASCKLRVASCEFASCELRDAVASCELHLQGKPLLSLILETPILDFSNLKDD